MTSDESVQRVAADREASEDGYLPEAGWWLQLNSLPCCTSSKRLVGTRQNSSCGALIWGVAWSPNRPKDPGAAVRRRGLPHSPVPPRLSHTDRPAGSVLSCCRLHLPRPLSLLLEQRQASSMWECLRCEAMGSSLRR